MRLGTKSVLFGAHCFLIHPWFVALAWWRLYGFPTDPRLWFAFFVHDLGYWGKPDMDGPEGETHVEWGALLMHSLFDGAGVTDGRTFRDTTWLDFCMYHSRFYAKRDGRPFSRLCVADKLAVALEPWWLYLPRVIASGEVDEYMDRAGGRPASKYNGEPRVTDPDDLVGLTPRRAWHRRMTNYCRAWAFRHSDGRRDTWTPERRSPLAGRAS